MTLLTENLYEQVLIDPAVKDGADTLYVVSGYASPYTVARHMLHLQTINKPLSINIILGMAPKDGVPRMRHMSFKELAEKNRKTFSCSYILEHPSIHTKLYIWAKEGKPLYAFTGSANYTNNGFGLNKNSYKEILCACDPQKSMEYYLSLKKIASPCQDKASESVVIDVIPTINKSVVKAPITTSSKPPAPITNLLTVLPEATEGERLTISFISKKSGNDVPEQHSLNWGNRPPGSKRLAKPGEACIPVSRENNRKGFFPPKNVHFYVHTDDGQRLLCARGGSDGKNLSTPDSNIIIGKYFRDRLGLPLGTLITRKILEKYGRTDVTFTKIDDENYEMDFSVPKK